MTKGIISFFFFLFLAQNSAFATTEITSFKEINIKNLPPDTLVLLDINKNILVERNDTQLSRKLTNKNEHYRLIEHDAAQTLSRLKSAAPGIVILALTTQSLRLASDANQRHDYLENASIPLSRNRFSHLNSKQLCGSKSAGFMKGVIYTAQLDKGVCLEDFLNQSGFQPAHLVFVDDLETNINDVKRFAQKRGLTLDTYLMRGFDTLKSYVVGSLRAQGLPKEFDHGKYLGLHQDLKDHVKERSPAQAYSFAQDHYLKWGIKENRFIGLPKDFDPQLYLTHNPDLIQFTKEHGLEPLAFAKEHYQKYGYQEGRTYKGPLPRKFDATIYLKLNRDLENFAKEHHLDPLDFAKEHYISNGAKENRQYKEKKIALPNDFNSMAYLALNKDIAQELQRSTLDATTFAKEHYRTIGYKQGRPYMAPLPADFDGEKYLKLNSDLSSYVKRHNINPIDFARNHYRNSGFLEHRHYK
ncbi:MAG: DUF2608 domain-containing protein [Alphaproteobacteria bacterium]|nr:DUF2608 domain-containing protein [Alphaproteobacteria bacterium]